MEDITQLEITQLENPHSYIVSDVCLYLDGEIESRNLRMLFGPERCARNGTVR